MISSSLKQLSQDLTAVVARRVVWCEDIGVFAFGKDELVLSEGFGFGVLAGHGFFKIVLGNDWAELWVRDNVSEYGVRASE